MPDGLPGQAANPSRLLLLVVGVVADLLLAEVGEPEDSGTKPRHEEPIDLEREVEACQRAETSVAGVVAALVNHRASDSFPFGAAIVKRLSSTFQDASDQKFRAAPHGNSSSSHTHLFNRQGHEGMVGHPLVSTIIHVTKDTNLQALRRITSSP